jgi:hypothetical protein
VWFFRDEKVSGNGLWPGLAKAPPEAR